MVLETRICEIKAMPGLIPSKAVREHLSRPLPWLLGVSWQLRQSFALGSIVYMSLHVYLHYPCLYVSLSKFPLG